MARAALAIVKHTGTIVESRASRTGEAVYDRRRARRGLATVADRRYNSPVKRFWLVKQEPTAYSWSDLERDGLTSWTGVRNFAARNNLRSMRQGDEVLFYHSVVGKAVVGIARVVREAYPDHTATEGDWSAVDLAPVRALATPVTLEQIKAKRELREMILVKRPRLSVQPVTPEEFKAVAAMGG